MKSERWEGPVLYVVVPCFDEEAVLDDTAEELDRTLEAMAGEGLIGEESRILFVDDGSTDRTWEKVRVLSALRPRIGGIALRPHGGHQTAMYTGLMESRAYCDAAVTMDADLQDDPAILPAMVEQFLAGKDVVYARRKSRRGDPLWKRATAWLFYRSMPAMKIHMPKDCGEYRLLSKRALEGLALFTEPDPFLRGLIPWPIHLLFWLGIGIALPALLRLIWLLAFSSRVSGLPGTSPALGPGPSGPFPGWETATVSIWAATGLLLMGMGILGAYILRIWRQVAGRPQGQVTEKVNVGRGTGN